MAGIFKLVTSVSVENPDLHDLELSGGDFANLPDGIDMIKQRILCRLWWLLGEWYLDQNQGTPWIHIVFRKGTPDAQLKLLFKRLVESIPGVNTVTSITITRSEGRVASLSFEATTDRGDIIAISDIDAPYGGLND